MNNEIFLKARGEYAAKNYEDALESFTECLQDESHPLEPGETGRLYHQIGNCLIKLKNPAEAIHAYTQAAADTDYDACGAVNYNLGMAYASLHDFEDAVERFEIAVSDAHYKTPYKAYTGMGNALLKLGKSAEAGVAFREAALDEANPDPTKALLNLGVCFMALGRPADAVASYESATQFDMHPDTANRLYANLGQAYVAIGQMQKAVDAFERAIADKTYFLSDSATIDYQTAITAVAQGTSEITQIIPSVSPGASAPMAKPLDESQGGNVDISGLDVTTEDTDIYADQVGTYPSDAGYYDVAQQGTDESDNQFFQNQDEEIAQWSENMLKQDKKQRHRGRKIVVTIIVLLLILVGLGAFFYTQGFGYPTQESVAQQIFADPQSAASNCFASSVSEEDATRMVSGVVTDDSITINGVDRSMNESTVYVTAQTQQGGDIQYRITMGRDLIGWKATGIELYFPSQS
ncbi:MAG: tetratricopeptide repeat protein [Eggerthellaceae bacterium]|jgi:tetratricopeptide (TPR) repeat protein